MTANEIRKRYNQELRAKMWQDMDNFIEEIALHVEQLERKQNKYESFNEGKNVTDSGSAVAAGILQYSEPGVSSELDLPQM